jgi:hypothetical protein
VDKQCKKRSSRKTNDKEYSIKMSEAQPENNPPKKKDLSDKQITSIIMVIAIAFIIVVAVLDQNEIQNQKSTISNLQHKVALLQNQTDLSNQYISILINKTLAHDQFNQQVVQWAQQEDNRTGTLEKKMVQHFGK